MCPENRFLHKQKGLGLPSALFLILVLTLLLAAMNQLNQVNADIYGREWLSLRAFYSAESAAQLAAVRVLNAEQAMGSCTTNYINNQSFVDAGMASCVASVDCSEDIVESVTFYTLTSAGICGSGLDQSRRIIQIRIKP